ncbi:MAG: hypothetical protein IPK50_05035 [Fibrobacterota bacterium]|nr:MAG: hypothetical protein IPK50_05035 [Fibrobacterota bacterium]
MSSRNRTFLVVALCLIALAWTAKLVWNLSFPYRSAKVAAKIKTLINQGATTEAVDLFEKSLSRLTVSDEFSCKAKLVLHGWYQGPSHEQLLSDAKSRGLPDDSLLTWRMGFALEEAFSAPFTGYSLESNARLKKLAQEAQYRRPEDPITSMIRALSHFQFREFSQCRKLVDPALSRWPESFLFRLLKGRCLVAQGKHDSALLVLPDLDSVLREEIGSKPDFDEHSPQQRALLLKDWYGAAMVGAHGVSAKQFDWDAKDCHHSYGPKNWSFLASGACKIQRRLHPADTASQCLQEYVSREDFTKMQELSKVYGGFPKCPEWADPFTASPPEPVDTTCLFGTGDSTKDAKCPE